MVSGPLPELIAKWVATPLPLMDIIADVMTPTYVESHSPVFSGPDFGHFTIITQSVSILGGREIVCDRCPRLHGLSLKVKKLGNDRQRWTAKCNSCDRITTFKLPDEDIIDERDEKVIMNVPGTNFLRTPYPPPTKSMAWRDKDSATNANPTTSPPVEVEQVGAELLPVQSRLSPNSH